MPQTNLNELVPEYVTDLLMQLFTRAREYRSRVMRSELGEALGNYCSPGRRGEIIEFFLTQTFDTNN